MTRLFALLLAMILLACSASCNSSTQTLTSTNKPQTDSIKLLELKQRKDSIDRFDSDTASLILLAKVPGANQLVRVFNGNFPEEVEVSYNLLKDKQGNVIYIFETPTSESGDWDIAYRSYYDQTGKLFAFERRAGFFNSECTDGAAHERLVKYYNHKFAVLDSTYSLTDHEKKPLKKSDCIFNYNFPYKIHSQVARHLAAIGL